MGNLREEVAAAKERAKVARAASERAAAAQRKKDEAAWRRLDRYKYPIGKLFGDANVKWKVTNSWKDGQELVDQITGFRIKVVVSGETVPDYGYVESTDIYAADVPSTLKHTGGFSIKKLQLRDMNDVALAFEWLDEHARRTKAANEKKHA